METRDTERNKSRTDTQRKGRETPAPEKLLGVGRNEAKRRRDEKESGTGTNFDTWEQALFAIFSV